MATPSSLSVRELPPDLTEDEKLAELVRCGLDPWYFITKYVYISDPIKGKISFEAWPHMEALVQATMTKKRLIILKARQIGVSWIFAAIALWYVRFRPNSTVVVVSKDGTASTRFKWRCEYIHRMLPEWMRLEVGKNNDVEFEFPSNDSIILSFAAGKEAGRSESATLVILDEWAFQEYARSIYTAILPTVEFGTLVGISTANGRGNLFAEVWKKAALHQNSYTPIFVKYNVRPGRDKAWWLAALKDAESPGKHRQEYPLTVADAFAVVQDPYFNIDRINGMPISIGDTFGDYSTIFYPHDEDEIYTAGIDSAPGGGDNAVLHILNSVGDQVAICKTNEGLDLFSDEAYNLLALFGFPFLIVEKQGEGTAVIRSFVSGVSHKGEKRRPYPRHRIYKKTEKNLGWHTGESNRDLILGQLRTAIRNSEAIIYDADTLEEFAGFGANEKTGKLEGLYGLDDTVMAYALAYEGRHHVTKPVSREAMDGVEYVSWGKKNLDPPDVPKELWGKRHPFECYVRVQRKDDAMLELCGINHDNYKEMLECPHSL